MARKISIKLISKANLKAPVSLDPLLLGLKRSVLSAGACPGGISGRCFSMIDIEHPEVI